jgi:succinoglycan biosynthesis transport protein ExoP
MSRDFSLQNASGQSGSPSSFEEDEGGSSLIQALPVILWERRWLLIIPAILGLIAGVGAAYTIPTMFESSATVLIESQQLPLDVVNSPVTDLIGQRIARARERVLSRQDLIRLIRSNNLYAEEQRRKPFSAIVDKMRDDTTIEAVGADASNNNRSIALRIGFSYSDPVKAQIVAQQYVNRFLEVDASSQTDQAVGAANFLNQQGAQLQAQIAKIKSENGPLLAMQSQSTGNPIADAASIDSDIVRLQGDNARLAATSGNDSGAVQAAEAAVAAARARYSDTHPDVIAALNQLDAARRSAGGARGSANPMIVASCRQGDDPLAIRGNAGGAGTRPGHCRPGGRAGEAGGCPARSISRYWRQGAVGAIVGADADRAEGRAADAGRSADRA